MRCRKVARCLAIGDVEQVHLQKSLEAIDGVGRPNCWRPTIPCMQCSFFLVAGIKSKFVPEECKLWEGSDNYMTGKIHWLMVKFNPLSAKFSVMLHISNLDLNSDSQSVNSERYQCDLECDSCTHG